MKIVGIAVLILVAYFVWRFVIRGDALVLVTPDAGGRVTAVVKRVVPDKEIVIEISNNSKANRITEISLSRAFAAQLGLSEPSGFRAETLPLSEGERKNREMAEYVEKYNKEEIRWVGNLALAPNAKTELVFPAKSASALTGEIRFQYEAKVGLGGSISWFRVNLAEQASNKAPRPSGG